VNGSTTRYCYYPMWRDADRILFVSSATGDDLYQFSILNASPHHLLR